MMRKTLPALLCAAALLIGGCTPRLEAAPQEDRTLREVPAAGLESETEPAASGSLSGAVVDLASSITPLAASSQYDLSFPQTFAITRPTETLTTTFSAYFITGTSDPGQPVYYGDTAIDRLGTKGLFGVLVNLNMGTNTFTFSQGGETETVTIVRQGPTVSTISEIVQSSMYPTTNGSATVGGTLLVECTAPSGASVSASFGGASTALQQVASATAGVPAVFRGSLAVGSDYPAGETSNQGKITYSMTYGGSSKTYQSSGDVFIAGQGSRLAVRVDSYIGFVYPDPSVPSNFRENLKEGGLDYIESQDNDYYKLSSGGYLATGAARIVEGTVNIQNTLSAVNFGSGSNNETFTFKGTKTPVFYTKAGDGSFSLTLFNTTGTPAVDTSSSRVFSGSTATDNGGSVTYTFSQKGAGNLWGYNVSYNGTDTVLRIAYKPALSGGSQPLSGVTIVLDPGHGKDDTGAFGVPGKTGPDENTINMVQALAAKEKLEAQGARVLMTRTATDEFLELDERLEFFENSGADMFLSIHHNSLAESADANKVSGMEVYYHSYLSQNFANRVMNGLAANLGRGNRWVQQSYYRVTMLPYAPSILCELGYLCNPLEYENITTQAGIDKSADALVAAVKNALS